MKRPYTEFWKVIYSTGQYNKYNSDEELQYVLEDLVDMIKNKEIYVKYQCYDRETMQLVGFFSPEKVYSGGIHQGGRYFKQHELITVLVLTKYSSDSIYYDQTMRPGSMVKKDISGEIPYYEIYM